MSLAPSVVGPPVVPFVAETFMTWATFLTTSVPLSDLGLSLKQPADVGVAVTVNEYVPGAVIAAVLPIVSVGASGGTLAELTDVWEKLGDADGAGADHEKLRLAWHTP